MRNSFDIKPKQIAAGILMAVFLFIHVVKIVHHHDNRLVKVSLLQSGKPTVNSADCSICDYHFVKDAHHFVAEFSSQTFSQLSVSYSDCFSQRITSIGLSSSDRGPPALA